MKKKVCLILFAILITDFAFSQETIFEPVSTEKYGIRTTIKNIKDKKKYSSDVYPIIKLNGGGGLSGNFDSTLAKSLKTELQLFLTEKIVVFTNFNLGVKPDTLNAGETIEGRTLIFPDANKVGFAPGTYYNLFNRVWGKGGSVALSVQYNYNIQSRTIRRIDILDSITAVTNTYSFNSSLHVWSANLKININSKKGDAENNIGFILSPYWRSMNTSNSTIDDFRAVFNHTMNRNTESEIGEIPRRYHGFGVKAVVFINKVNFYFMYSYMWAKFPLYKEFNFPGLTKEQYVIGASVTADFLNW